jgi:histidine triad (HIT) family protein
MKTHDRCIFCAIRAGSEPCSRVYQDEHVLAFMDIRPVRPGQLVVIPGQHIDHFCDLPDDLAAHVLLTGQRCARALREMFQPQRVGMIVHGFGVPHAHLLVLPLHHVWDITSAANGYIEEGAIRFRWDQVALAARGELDHLAARIAGRLID